MQNDRQEFRDKKRKNEASKNRANGGFAKVFNDSTPQPNADLFLRLQTQSDFCKKLISYPIRLS